MENESKNTCWNYIDVGGRNEVPVVQVEIINSEKGYKYTFVVDTGYDGGVLIPYAIYEDLKLYKHELPRDMWSIGEVVSGEIIPLITASYEVRVHKVTFESTIETFKGNKEFLVGLSFLEKFTTTLYGKNKMGCLEVEK